METGDEYASFRVVQRPHINTAACTARRLEEAQLSVVRLEGALLAAGDEQEQLRRAAADSAADVTALQTARRQGEAALARMAAALDRKVDAAAHAQAELAGVMDERNALAQEVQKRKALLKERAAECEALLAARAGLEADVREARRAAGELRQSAAAAEEARADEAASLSDARREVQALKLEVANLTDREASALDDAAALRGKIKAVQEELGVLTTRCEEAKAARADAEHCAQGATARAERAEMDGVYLTEQNALLQRRIEAGEEAGERAAAVAEATKKAVTAKELEIHRLSLQATGCEEELKRCRQAAQKAEAAHAKVAEDLAAARQQHQRDMQKVLQEKEGADDRAHRLVVRLTAIEEEKKRAGAAAKKAEDALQEEVKQAARARRDAEDKLEKALAACHQRGDEAAAELRRAQAEAAQLRAGQQRLKEELAAALKARNDQEREASAAHEAHRAAADATALELRAAGAEAARAAGLAEDLAAARAELAECTACRVREGAEKRQLESLQVVQKASAERAAQDAEEARAALAESAAARVAAEKELQSLRAAHDALTEQMASSEPLAQYVGELVAKYQACEAERRRVSNQLIEARGNIRVACRLRPIPPAAHPLTVDHPTPHGLTVTLPNGKDRAFKFDNVLQAQAQQEEVFATQVADLIPSVLDGYNVCIMAYGQTGSGKTHTMFGQAGTEHRGVIPRSLERFWEMAAERGSGLHDVSCSLSMVEIYCGDVRDLLADRALTDSVLDNLSDARKSTTAKFMMGSDAVTHKLVEVAGLADCMAVMGQGYARRAASATLCNEHSSRSHCIVSLHYRCVFRPAAEEGVGAPGAETTGRMVLVDLGGSECVSKAGIEGIQIRECAHINRSLSALSDVLMALSAGNAHVPYRNSKLTHLLSDCLGGDAKMQLFVTINPDKAQLAETQHTLSFGHRARQVKRGAATRHVTSLDAK